MLHNQAAQLGKSLRKLREAQSDQSRTAKSEHGQRSGSASNSQVFEKRSTTFLVKAKENDEDIEPVSHEIISEKQQPIQLWRVPLSDEESDTTRATTIISSAISTYSQMKTVVPIGGRSRSNSLTRQQPGGTDSLPQLPSLPVGNTTKPNIPSGATSSLVSRAMNRQAVMAMKGRLGSAGKQRQQPPPQPPPSSPYDKQKVSSSDRLNWDLYTCVKCSKTYSNERDLDIHSAYCT